MTTYHDMTKAELNALLPENMRCKNASQLKKTSKADLIAELEALEAPVVESNHFGIDPDDVPATNKPTPARKRGLNDRVILEPGRIDDVKPTKEGSKRALLVRGLQCGATIEHLMEILGWNRETVSSALRTDLKAIGLGCERRKGKYFLLMPEGMKKLPLRDATTSRADALVAACK